MHGIHGSVARRLERLERRFGAVLEPETAAETDRRLVLVRAAHSGHEPADLQEDERLTFQKIKASIPVFLELRHEGIVGDDGEPGGAVDPFDAMVLEDEDEDGCGEI